MVRNKEKRSSRYVRLFHGFEIFAVAGDLHFYVNQMMLKQTYPHLQIRLPQLIAGILLFFSTTTLQAQVYNLDNEKIQLGEKKNLLCWMELSPDAKTLSISSTQGYPLFQFDWQSKSLRNTYTVNDWYAGSRLNYSPDGSKILLQHLYYADYKPNEDREVEFQVVDAKNGTELFKINNAHDVRFMPDSKHLLSIEGDHLNVIEISSGKKVDRHKFYNASVSAAIDPAGKLIAVAVHPDDKEALENIPSLRQDRKALKKALEYKQMIEILDAETYETKYTVQDLFDLIFRVEFSADGKFLLVLHTPHTKTASSVSAKQSYVSVIDMSNGEVLRTIFLSTSDFEPQFRLHPNGRIFGIETKGRKFREIHLYDFASGDLLERYELSYRLLETLRAGEFVGDGRNCFEFLPDNSVIIVTGNRLQIWKPDCLNN
jgi:hypothetical protein